MNGNLIAAKPTLLTNVVVTDKIPQNPTAIVERETKRPNEATISIAIEPLNVALTINHSE